MAYAKASSSRSQSIPHMNGDPQPQPSLPPSPIEIREEQDLSGISPHHHEYDDDQDDEDRTPVKANGKWGGNGKGKARDDSFDSRVGDRVRLVRIVFLVERPDSSVYEYVFHARSLLELVRLTRAGKPVIDSSLERAFEVADHLNLHVSSFWVNHQKILPLVTVAYYSYQ